MPYTIFLALKPGPQHLPGIQPPTRCHLHSQPTKRGTIRYVGPIASLPGPEGAPWIGIELDEPFGKNDGRAPDGTRVFDCRGMGYGVFARAERVVAGDFGVLGMDEEGEGDEMEEI